jgi:hypothetical protein
MSRIWYKTRCFIKTLGFRKRMGICLCGLPISELRLDLPGIVIRKATNDLDHSRYMAHETGWDVWLYNPLQYTPGMPIDKWVIASPEPFICEALRGD